jgi:hypothetical protein
MDAVVKEQPFFIKIYLENDATNLSTLPGAASQSPKVGESTEGMSALLLAWP